MDGINAHRHAEDYQVQQQSVGATDQLEIELKPGGGAVVLLERST